VAAVGERVARELRVSINVSYLLIASVIVLSTYVLLIETWRRVLAVYGKPISFVDAAHVWFVANLGKYVPGKIWQVTAMTTMTTSLGVRVVDRRKRGGCHHRRERHRRVRDCSRGRLGSSAHLGCRLRTRDDSRYRHSRAALIAAPWTVKWVSRAASRLVGKELNSSRPPARSGSASPAARSRGRVWRGVSSVRPRRHRRARWPWTAYLAAYTLSYLVGYLALFAPGGIGARELVLGSALQTLHLASPAEAVLITVGSRLWLTVLEIIPGVLFLPRRLKTPPVSS
jgi:hypothetical protein